jgi:endonuclease/exonuclease/phosphatase family metal-dependent hydrolase
MPQFIVLTYLGDFNTKPIEPAYAIMVKDYSLINAGEDFKNLTEFPTYATSSNDQNSFNGKNGPSILDYIFHKR